MKNTIEIISYFFRLGCVGFGGPLALIAQMQRDLVEKRGWISEGEFRQAFAMIKAMPGPVAIQAGIYLGRRRGGFWGGLLGGIALILPAFFLMIFLAATYNIYVEWPMMVRFLEGIQMAALALIFYSLKSLTMTYWKTSRFWILLLLGGVLTVFAAIPEVFLIFLLGCWSVILERNGKNGAGGGFGARTTTFSFAIPVVLWSAWEFSQDQVSVLSDLWWVSLKAGALMFGTGLAIIPSLQADFVTTFKWVNIDEFRDALAFGQITPGPVVITVTFLGFKVAGLTGAIVASIGVFAPSFFHQLTWFPKAMDRMSKFNWISSFILGAIAAVTAGILYVIAIATKDINAFQGLVFFLSLLLLFRTRVHPVALIFGAGGASLLLHFF